MCCYKHFEPLETTSIAQYELEASPHHKPHTSAHHNSTVTFIVPFPSSTYQIKPIVNKALNSRHKATIPLFPLTFDPKLLPIPLDSILNQSHKAIAILFDLIQKTNQKKTFPKKIPQSCPILDSSFDIRV